MSQELSRSGYLSEEELKDSPGVPSEARRRTGPVAIIECTQDIPCNPCEASCKVGAISVGKDITNLPQLDEQKCVGCKTCVFICPGQAIFVVDESLENGRARVTIPYEFLPLPEKGDTVIALDRSGKELGEAQVTSVRKTEKMDETSIVTIEVPREWSMRARGLKRKQ
jgi:Fe-S-cluster-containing hydrogenase component 2